MNGLKGSGAQVRPELSALVVVHNEAGQLADCLDRLTFADEIVVVLDKCTDASAEIAARYTDRLVEGSFDREGERRNTGIDACTGPWILEVDADERVPDALAREIRETIADSDADRHLILVDNYIGGRLVRRGWGGSFGKPAYPGLFRKETKHWGKERVHPSLTFSGREGERLAVPLEHYVDDSISDMIRRLDRYSTLRGRDIREKGNAGSYANDVRRIFSRFLKCYLRRGWWREGGYGFLIALFAGLYPILSHLKADLEDD